MQDLRDAIQATITNACPIKLGKLIVGYTVGKYDMDILVGEYNIHFIEPDDEQSELDTDPSHELKITLENINVLEYDY